MIAAHQGRRPRVDPDAWVAPTAVLVGDVRVGAHSHVLHGAVLTADTGGPLSVGTGCVIMEQAVLRASKRFPLTLGSKVLIGPHAYLTGCTVGACSFLATGSMVFNGSRLGPGCRISLGGVVHINSELAADSHVPIGHVAVGRPARIFDPPDSPLVHAELDRLSGGFFQFVFGVEQQERAFADVMDEVMARYGRALETHRHDTVLEA